MGMPLKFTGIGIKSEFYSNADCFAMPEIDYTERGGCNREGKTKQNTVVFLDKGLNPGPST